MRQFPRLVYKSAAHHILVENEAEHAAALEAGWHDTVPAALGHKPVEPAPAAKIEDLTKAPTPKKNGKKVDEAPAVKPSWES
jgi:hypothetical protein